MGRPGFWLPAGAVFAGNGLFSAWQHNWWLAAMQLGTAMLAARAAVITNANCELPDDRFSEVGERADSQHRAVVAKEGRPTDRG